ncbi:MAG: hypothetical protein A3A65_04570 [Candidatus Chisholmbacteria bacterium RIFCSPLOWO2_01_FULL_49_14]|uniref:Glycosyltransferase 2-like domain-containing protein n=1 Tax=Candidatus Chisholmbacteria bacterium RIFCSPLOWO2_01_FULL_49_14 TaxID=1797593 RepID=A0A1G1W478_9BACT|nr:MAG: hypothetical protein A3A65_04570 [Candidatus Chisholmbacteria bacterium RIFCSPLOWO2_01_FULL_49_14]
MTSVEIALPVYNEEQQLVKSIALLQTAIKAKKYSSFAISVRIINNASSDSTPRLAEEIARTQKNVKVLHIPKKGRGAALMTCWLNSKAEILSYMDIDLSADLRHLKDLLDTIAKREADIAVGSRLAKGAHIEGRTPLRGLMSRGYNLLIKVLFATHFSDAQCGFKAISRQAFQRLAPHIRNRNWFFDSEMLIIAEKAGMRIKDIPLVWTDDSGSTVKVLGTITEDILGLLRLVRTKPWKTA